MSLKIKGNEAGIEQCGGRGEMRVGEGTKEGEQERASSSGGKVLFFISF